MPRKTHAPTKVNERPRTDLISVTEAAERCQVHYRTLRKWISEGRIEAVRVGPRLLKIDPAELDKLYAPVGVAK